MNVALLAGDYPPDIKGGGEISTQILAEILAQAGCDVSVLTCGLAASTTAEGDVAVYRFRRQTCFGTTRSGLQK